MNAQSNKCGFVGTGINNLGFCVRTRLNSGMLFNATDNTAL